MLCIVGFSQHEFAVLDLREIAVTWSLNTFHEDEGVLPDSQIVSSNCKWPENLTRETSHSGLFFSSSSLNQNRMKKAVEQVTLGNFTVLPYSCEFADLSLLQFEKKSTKVSRLDDSIQLIEK